MKSDDPAAFSDLVAHCASIAVSLGFDAVKTWFTDDPKTFMKVTNASGGMPILIAGGPKVEASNALRTAQSAFQCGAAGVSYGRNLFGRRTPVEFISQLREMKRHH
jgi:DhnA family fructose-bisphosphate aldolase class Ia